MVNHRCQQLLLVALTAAALVVLTAAQSSQIPSCASKLTGCAEYINGSTTKPPSTCCDPLKEAVTKERDCLCKLYDNPDLLKAFQINVTQALDLPKRCQIDTGKSNNICKDTAPSPSSSGSGSPTTPSGSGSGGTNGADKITGTAFVSSFLLIVGAYLFFY